MKTTASIQTVLTAIKLVNEEQGYQIETNRLDKSGKYTNFTLKSKSGIPGARTSHSGRNLACASWHAHGYVMDKIFELEPECYIDSMGSRLFKGFQWEDKNIGSIISPMYFSETSIL